MLFDPHDPHELATALLAVTCDADVRRNLVERGLARAREFTWQRTARQTLDVLKEVA